MDFCFLLFRIRLIQSMVQHSSFNAWSCCGLEESIDKHQIICCRWPQDGNLSSWEGHPPSNAIPPPGNGPLKKGLISLGWFRGEKGYQKTSNFININNFLYNNPKKTKSAQKFEIPDGRYIFWPKEWENSKMKIIDSQTLARLYQNQKYTTFAECHAFYLNKWNHLSPKSQFTQKWDSCGKPKCVLSHFPE